MKYICYAFMFSLFYLESHCFHSFAGWGGSTIHCRDNDNLPVDWWYIYKPPSGVRSLLDDGRNFSYITSRENGRWRSPHETILANSMLQFTLGPLYRKTYTTHLGAVIYKSRGVRGDNVTNTHGLLMTDIVGGLWLSHTVPGFPDLNNNQAMIPKSELGNGHLLVCLSTKFKHQNVILEAVKQARADIQYKYISKLFYNGMNVPRHGDNRNDIKLSHISTHKGQHINILSRPPGTGHCMYQNFAEEHGIILDIYGQSTNQYLTTICSKKYGLRNIESISMKHPDEVMYITHKPDRAIFAVSTAAHWQLRGTSPAAYWVCTSNVHKYEQLTKGGLMICVQHYGIWLSFDNLKVAEPECY